MIHAPNDNSKGTSAEFLDNLVAIVDLITLLDTQIVAILSVEAVIELLLFFTTSFPLIGGYDPIALHPAIKHLYLPVRCQVQVVYNLEPTHLILLIRSQVLLVLPQCLPWCHGKRTTIATTPMIYTFWLEIREVKMLLMMWVLFRLMSLIEDISSSDSVKVVWGAGEGEIVKVVGGAFKAQGIVPLSGPHGVLLLLLLIWIVCCYLVIIRNAVILHLKTVVIVGNRWKRRRALITCIVALCTVTVNL